jgi:hypothetical protein
MREIDGGTETVAIKLARDHHHRFTPEYTLPCDLAQHHEGEEKPLDIVTRKVSVWMFPRLKTPAAGRLPGADKANVAY